MEQLLSIEPSTRYGTSVPVLTPDVLSRKTRDPDPALDGFKSLGLRLIDACNLHCTMCGQAAQRQERVELKIVKKRPFLELADLKRIIDNAAPYKPHVYLWGGEPLIYPYLGPLMEHIASRDMAMFITTNGYYLNRFVEPIVDLGVVEVCVSIDGPQDLHDRVRGKEGSYVRAVRNLGILRDYKMKANRVLPILEVHCVIVPQNYKRIIEFIEILNVENLCRRIRVQLPMFFSNEMSNKYRAHVAGVFGDLGEESWTRFVGDFEGMDFNHLKETWRRLRTEFSNVTLLPDVDEDEMMQWFLDPEVVVEPIVEYKKRATMEDGPRKCAAVDTRISIEPNGDVIGCSDFPETIVGNIHTQSLEEIYKSKVMEIHRSVARGDNGAACGICSRCSYLYIY